MEPCAPRSSLTFVLPLLLAASSAAGGGCVAAPQAPATVIDWALGPEHLGNEPQGAIYIDAVDAEPAAALSEPAHPRCMKATSFIPVPDDRRIFVLLDGQVHVLATRNSEPRRLGGITPAPRLTRLLAVTRPPASLALLVAARPAGATAEQLWQLALSEDKIQDAREVKDRRAFTDQETFFKQYDAPRCLPGGKQCLVLSTDGTASYLDVEPVRGKPQEQYKKLGKVVIADFAWGGAEGRTIYLARPCPAPAPSP